jgi:dTDP-4-amino-4,6-dideoxy-D-galactose acyltransferase
VSNFSILEWDSARFGFPVGRLSTSVQPEEIPTIAQHARGEGVRLVYYTTPADVRVDPATLEQCGGRLVDQRVTYAADLDHVGQEVRSEIADDRVAEYESDAVTQALMSLARQSGEYSRFHSDPRVPPGVFESIYDAWITRSVQHEIADHVAVVRDGTTTAGFVTLKAAGAESEIGLLAVEASMRGRGYGRALVHYALHWARRHSCSRARVVTQQANRPACALYERCGYLVERIEHVYHLWL